MASPLEAQKAAPEETRLSQGQFAHGVLAALQEKSFINEVEFCGYIGRLPSGDFVATPGRRGDIAGCDMPRWPTDMLVVASYHTHGHYSFDYNSEFPSVQDMETDEADGIDGYVATPGGRLWFIDSSELIASQICGLRCLPQDPDFVDHEGVIQLSYTYQELLRGEQ